jgi:hypothetical protein
VASPYLIKYINFETATTTWLWELLLRVLW